MGWIPGGQIPAWATGAMRPSAPAAGGNAWQKLHAPCGAGPSMHWTEPPLLTHTRSGNATRSAE